MSKVLSKISWQNNIGKAEVLELLPLQEEFIKCDADIAITGGGAGGGKTVSVIGFLMLPKFVDNPRFRAIMFRRLYPQIIKPGGLLDESERWLKSTGAKLNRSLLEFTFKSGAKVGYAHLQHSHDKKKYQGQNIDVIVYDELTHFLEDQFWYVFSRVRSTSGKTYVRATCNSDADSWVYPLISWWIDPKTGYAIPERAGIKRYFIRLEDDGIYWGDTAQELIERFPGEVPISLAFFPSNLEDNPILTEADPSYKGKLQAQSKVERERLLKGNWLIRASETQLFDVTLIPDRAIGQWQAPQYGHSYLIGIDPNFGAMGGDFFVCQCWDLTSVPYRLVAEYRSNNSSTTSSMARCVEMVKDYAPTIVSVEKNGGGQTILERLIEECPDIDARSLNQSDTSKVIHTDRIALALESGTVRFPPDWVGISEMYNFSRISREAASGYDDSVMAWSHAFAYLQQALEAIAVSPFLR